MEKTIKSVMERTIVSSELLNENSLLVVSQYGKVPFLEASVVYVENEAIHEDIIGKVEDSTIIEYNDNMVAVRRKQDEPGVRSLITVYDLEYHSFVENDFLEEVYNSDKDGIKQLIK